MAIRKKRIFIVLGIILGVVGLFIVLYTWPQYAFRNIPSPSGSWQRTEYSRRKYPASRNYYILKRMTRINITDNDIGIDHMDGIAEYFENWFDVNGIARGNPGGSKARCEEFLPGISINEEASFLAHYYPKSYDRYYVSEVICVAIYPCGTCIDENFEIIVVTGNPHWLDKFEFEFTHPRAE